MTFINPWETKKGSHQEVRLQHPHISYKYVAALLILYIQVRIPVVHDHMPLICGCYSLITINFKLPRVAHITNVLKVLSTCSCKIKWVFARGCYSLIIINFILPRVAHITNVLHVLSTCSCKIKRVFARGCYSLITINFILPRVAHITNVLHVLSTCSCKLRCFLVSGCYSLITINLPRVARITTNL